MKILYLSILWKFGLIKVPEQTEKQMEALEDEDVQADQERF